MLQSYILKNTDVLIILKTFEINVKIYIEVASDLSQAYA